MAAEIFEKLSNIFSSSVTVKAEEEDEEEEEEEEVMKKWNIFLMEIFFWLKYSLIEIFFEWNFL